jgi:DNA-3-methyladenine glycosylase I
MHSATDMNQLKRCGWAKSEIMVRYHDEEWGVPLHDDQMLFEFLCLEGAQAGLSWETILKKRDNYRHAFDAFRPEVVAKYNQKKVAALLADSGIVRNRLKIASVIQNAKAFRSVQKEFGSFDKYIWQFAPKKSGKAPKDHGDVPARTDDSDRMSKDLRKRGFGFVGSTICYAFMQAVGIVNDHNQNCFRRDQV